MTPHISSLKYLDEEFNNIENTFQKLLYLKPFIHFGQSKALKIKYANLSQIAINTPSNNIKQFFH